MEWRSRRHRQRVGSSKKGNAASDDADGHSDRQYAEDRDAVNDRDEIVGRDEAPERQGTLGGTFSVNFRGSRKSRLNRALAS